MNLNSLHILVTYRCNYECAHCFVWGSPRQSGVFTLAQLEEVFQQALATSVIDELYFEGGETFIYYPVLLKAVRRASALGFETGIVTNGYWATGLADARAWLEPLAAAGLNRLEVSADLLHGDPAVSPPDHVALRAADALKLPASLLVTRSPAVVTNGRVDTVAGDVMFRGRAASAMTEELPRQPWRTFTRCPAEELADPTRVHVDPFGYLHLCQGIVMGNLFERPLDAIINGYDPHRHPVVREIVAGGPAELVRHYHLAHTAGYVDACHLCFTAREALRSRFPEVLAPDQMYGVA